MIEMKATVHDLAMRASEQLRRRLAARDDKRLATFRVETDLIEHLLRQFYFTRKIAKEVVSMRTQPSSAPGVSQARREEEATPQTQDVETTGE